MRFRLRTLMIVLAIGPMLLAWSWFAYRSYVWRRELIEYLRYAGAKNYSGPGDPPPFVEIRLPAKRK